MQSVKLIGITKPTITIFDDMKLSAEGLIAYCARVSNPANQDNPDSEKLLKYLVKHKHWSPFEMVHIVMEINTTRDIARQILRHRSFSFQEFSQRYAVAQEYHTREPRYQDQKNRQSSIEFDMEESDDEDLRARWFEKMRNVLEVSSDAYKWALDYGIAKEQARVFLPEGLTMSRMYMSGSLRSWIHYCELRMGNGTQKEHREIATQCWNVIVKEFPSLENVLES